MHSRLDRDKQQRLAEKHKDILSLLLAKEENKFCADCLAKGPRWASWNLGVLICIRCSGLHRSLGVHISKVKSVNLDTWTSEQINCFCRRGNGWAKEYYEARLPRDFKRPQSDSSMDYFIRDKYEKKKYCSASEIPLRSVSDLGLTENGNEQKKRKPKVNNVQNTLTAPKSNNANSSLPSIPRPKSSSKLAAMQNGSNANTPVNTATQDLLGLDTPSPAHAQTNNTTKPNTDLMDDLFGPMSSYDNNPPASANNAPQQTTNVSNADLLTGLSQPEAPATNAPTQEQQKAAEQKMSKDSILSLYKNTPNPTSNPMQMNGSAVPMQMSGFNQFQNQQMNQFYPGANMTQQSNAYNMANGMNQQQMMAMQQQMQMQQMQQMQQQNTQMMNNYNMVQSQMPQQQQQMYAMPQQQIMVNPGYQMPTMTNANPHMMPQNNQMQWSMQQNANPAGQTLCNQLWK